MHLKYNFTNYASDSPDEEPSINNRIEEKSLPSEGVLLSFFSMNVFWGFAFPGDKAWRICQF